MMVNMLYERLNKIKNIFNKDLIYKILSFLFYSVVFGFTFRQPPLYVSNQHTKFLHGLAKAGYGHLNNDWLAKTIDPLPFFSFIVYVTCRFMHEYFFYLYFILILGVFAYSLINIILEQFDLDKTILNKLIIFVIIISLHSTFFDSIIYRFFKIRLLEWIFTKGVAGQYLIATFQPCIFGVFLLLSILYFLRNRPFIAVFFIAVASNIHSVYLFMSAVLTLTYMIIIIIENKDYKKAFFIGLVSFILVLPVIIYNYFFLKPTDSEIMKESIDILVNVRIPQHSIPKLWIDFTTFIKIGIILIAIFIVRKKRLFLILLIPFVTAVLFTIYQMFFQNDFIAFIAPWRISVWLVPLSTSIVAGYIIFLLNNKTNIFSYKHLIYFMTIMAISFYVLYGLYGTIKQMPKYIEKDILPVEKYVKNNKKENNVYLVPVKMMDFRLNTGAPVLVTYKSHPYKDVELMEWYERVKKAEEFYGDSRADKNQLIMDFKNNYRITHIVWEKGHGIIENTNLIEVYSDGNYIIYKIN